MNYYAGIGSRDTPTDVLALMTKIAQRLASNGWTLRSGGAAGADTAFEKGCSKFEVFTQADATTAAVSMAGKYHPAWHRCNDYVKRLHARNCQILLGRDVTKPKPVKAIICWTPGGAVTGGTGQALRMAPDYHIPVINLATVPTLERVMSVIDSTMA